MHTFSSGAKSSEPAPRFDLLELEFLRLVAARMAGSATSHGIRNYRKGAGDAEFLQDRINHLVAHALALAAGDTSDDHLAAVGANCNIIAWLVTQNTVTPTYDERRHDIQPCRCGRLFTHPERCQSTGRCLAENHPHASKVSA